ncbi:hypothetical protein [Desulfogranum marinum]|uniref:hypothetical protein n=1 Tax=Desulfogranum marinum TaxID=453220 RepID=UPI00196554F3|nr:hypothetical protein [Desulfogranum marinum]MBM9512938.1 hypothetical protein [Desulfogranum marinum]
MMVALPGTEAKDVPSTRQKDKQWSIYCSAVVQEKRSDREGTRKAGFGAYAPELVVYIKQ